MFFDFNLLDVFMYEYPRFVAPHECYHYNKGEFFNPFNIFQMGFLDIEAAGFHGFKASFYLPSLFVIDLCLLGFIERSNDQEVGTFSFAIYFAAWNVAQLRPNLHDPFVM